ncbi:MAG: hypothetical protein AAF443_05215 [Chlamydiota bacterium]
MKDKKRHQINKIGSGSLAEQSFKYWEIFLSWLFKYPSRCYELELAKTAQVFENPCDALYRLGQSYRATAASKGIICQVTNNAADLDRVNDALKNIYTYIVHPTLSDLAIAEVLAKVVAYRELCQGNKLAIPSRQPNGEMALTFYSVDTVFDLWNRIRAFGLTSSSQLFAPPILLFRGTDFSLRSKGGRASIISDLDPKGPGWAVFEKAEPTLQNWLKTQGKRKTRLIGHSLGGAIVSYTLIKEFCFINPHDYACSYAFNFPGISDQLFKQWNALPSEQKPAFKGVVCRGDVVSKFGKLFGDIFEVSLPAPLSPITAHELLLFAEPLCYLHRVALAKENNSPSRNFYSKMQQQTSSLIYEFGLKFLFP